MTTEQTQDAPRVIMLPPTLVLLHIVAGITLNWIVGGRMDHGWGWLGLILLAATVGITQWSKNVFQKAGTNVAPNKPALSIVTEGPYAYSRNPMYVCFMLGYAGLAFLASAPAMLLMLFPLFYFLDQRVIAPEEEYLTEKFGEDYIRYKARVRRWV